MSWIAIPLQVNNSALDCSNNYTCRLTIAGVLVVGGYGSANAVEVFLPGTKVSCPMKSLPTGRWQHTLSTVDNQPVACGGGGSAEQKTCDIFKSGSGQGSWEHYAHLASARSSPTALSSGGDLLLLGGYYSQTTTELVGKGLSYDLRQKTG